MTASEIYEHSYGFHASGLNEAITKLEGLLAVSFHLHDSSFYGEYGLCKGKDYELRVFRNLIGDAAGAELLEPTLGQWPFVLRVTSFGQKQNLALSNEFFLAQKS